MPTCQYSLTPTNPQEPEITLLPSDGSVTALDASTAGFTYYRTAIPNPDSTLT